MCSRSWRAREVGAREIFPPHALFPGPADVLEEPLRLFERDGAIALA